MKLHEYQAKIRFAQFGIPIPQGRITTTPQEVYEVTLELNTPVAIKPQVMSSEREKVTGIQFANDPQEAQLIAKALFESGIDGVPVRAVLVETAYRFTTRIHVSITYDRTAGKPLMTAFSPEHRESIQQLPRDIGIETIHPILGVHQYQARNLASIINLPYEHWTAFTNIVCNLSRCYLDSDAAIAEISPLVITDEGQLIALDGGIQIDEYALFRQPEIVELGKPNKGLSTNTVGVNYIRLDGQIGCIVNGSGLGMATMDAIQFYGNEAIRAACMIDIGSEASESKLQSALNIILTSPEVRILMLNLFAMVTPSDQTARILLRLLDKMSIQIPTIVRFGGEKADEGVNIIRGTNLPYYTATRSLIQAAIQAVEAAREGNSWQS